MVENIIIENNDDEDDNDLEHIGIEINNFIGDNVVLH